MDVRRLVIEAGDLLERFSAGSEKGFFALHANFFQRFEAVRDESGAEHEDTLAALLGKPDEFEIGKRFQPRLAGKTGLKRHRMPVRRNAGARDQGPRCRQNLGTIARGVNR